MNYVDLFILDAIEGASRAFQRLTGRTNVWLAVQFTNLSIIVYFVWAGMYFWSRGVMVRSGLALFCASLLYVLTQTLFKVPIESSEAAAYRRVAKGFRNPRRVRDSLLRISFLTLSLVLAFPILFVYFNQRVSLVLPSYSQHVSVVLLSYSLIVLTTVVLYLLACDPLPPCAGRVREWLQRLSASRLRVLDRDPETPG